MIILIFRLINSQFNIQHFGAIPYSDSLQSQFKNSQAIKQALKAANCTLQQLRTVIVPAKKFYFMPFLLNDLYNIRLLIQGSIIASKNVSHWPQDPHSGKYKDFIQITNCRKFQITGGGRIDGRGYHWWILVLFNIKKYLPNNGMRPHLIIVKNSSQFSFNNLILKNSMNFHIKLDDCAQGKFYNLKILVNTTAQFNLLKYKSIQGIVPAYAFNTDGIDPHGINMHFYNITVQNYDDVIVPKPGHKGDRFSNCTQNMLIQDIKVILGVGMSIGSVPPNIRHSCIKNITFRRVQFNRPFKAIYIKTNPGQNGDGQIRNIKYQNMTIYKPIWWAIYIGPQQMKQPDGSGPGCLLFPFDPRGTCQTQPRITIDNITLKNIKIHNSLLYPVTIRCNISNPCINFLFQNVTTDRWFIGQRKTGVLCQNVKGTQVSTKPSIYCFQNKYNQGLQQNDLYFSEKQINKLILKQLQEAIKEVGFNDNQQDQMQGQWQDYLFTLIQNKIQQ